MRTIDVARATSCSVNQVRKLEQAGVLPPVPRSSNGYRDYRQIHLRSLLAYQQLVGGVGPLEARQLLREAHRDIPALLARLDSAHTRLHQERREVALAREAVHSIGAEPLADIHPEDTMTIGQLALALGVRPSTLRHWESEGLLTPARASHRARRYSPADVRDARLVHQLRQAGYRIAPLRELLPALHTSGEWEPLLAGRERSIHQRSAALLHGTATLASVVFAQADLTSP